MKHVSQTLLSRRLALQLLVLSGLAGGLARSFPAAAATLPKVVVNTDPNCGCCQNWADHLNKAGFQTIPFPSGLASIFSMRRGCSSSLCTISG